MNNNQECRISLEHMCSINFRKDILVVSSMNIIKIKKSCYTST